MQNERNLLGRYKWVDWKMVSTQKLNALYYLKELLEPFIVELLMLFEKILQFSFNFQCRTFRLHNCDQLIQYESLGLLSGSELLQQ